MNKQLQLLLALSAVVFSANVWGPSIYILDEAKNAGCAMEMYQRGDWVVPTFNGDLRTDKPPLHYFFMQGAFRVFGINGFSARIFSTLMGVLTIASVFFFVKRIVNERSALFSSLILIASIQLAIQFHLAVPDAYLIFFLTTAWLSFFYGWRSDGRFLYLFYVCVGLATLAKGPISMLFSGLIVLLFLIIQRELSVRKLIRLKILEGILIFCLLVLPWYVLVGIRTHGAWLEGFFLEHNVSRFTSTMEGHKGFPLASFVILVAGLMPFSFFGPQAARMFWVESRQDPFIRFCVVAVTVIIVFFALSRTILPNYPEPAFPFFGILLGCFFSRGIHKSATEGKLWIDGLVYLVVSAGLPLAVSIALRQDDGLSDLSYLSAYFFILPAGALAGLIFLIKGSLQRAFYAYAGSLMLFTMVFFYRVFPEVDRKNPVVMSKSLLLESPLPVLYYKDFNPAYTFTLQKTIPKISTQEDIQHLVGDGRGVIVLTQKRYIPELEGFGLKIVFEGKDLFENHVTVILQK
jgi:4-amino-4-deoxy-L-arabinose transferase-like glycosyltransferase